MTAETPIRKVLIYRLGSLGDMVAALPCLHLIERSFPGAERRMLTNFPVNAKAPAAAAVLGESGLVHGYMRYRVGTRSAGELLRVALEVRRFQPDLLIYLMPSRSSGSARRDWLFFRLAGVRRAIGRPMESEAAYRLNAATGLYESEAVRLARTIAELGDAHPEDLRNWDLRLTAAEREVAGRELAPLGGRPVLACAPGCKMQSNDWEVENWRELVGRLWRRYPRYALVMTGASEDAAYCAEIAKAWEGVKTDLSGKLTPRESAAVFAHATVFLGPDSGPKHLAASVGVPCVCIFGARDLPGVWFPPGNGNEILYHRPQCAGCGLEICIEMQKQCVRSVTVEEMEQAVERVLQRRSRI